MTARVSLDPTFNDVNPVYSVVIYDYSVLLIVILDGVTGMMKQ